MLGTELQGYKVIQPIETVYKGYKFRSRLEARWAVFFDKLGIEWEYEPEGFDLGNGVYYLPDFYLPEFCCYVEIKPKTGFDEDSAIEKLEVLSEEKGCISIFCKGDPMDNDIEIYCCDVDDSGGGGPAWKECGFEKNSEGKEPKAVIVVYEWKEDREYCDCDFGIIDNICNTSVYQENIGCFNSTFIETAKLAARQARFEHGETP